MNILEFDLGNTRAKWRLLQNASTSASGVIEYSAFDAAWRESVFAALPAPPERVRLSCVAGEDIQTRLAEIVRAQWQIDIEVAKVQPVCAGLTQAYADPSKLGVDRWLSMLAAYNSAPTASACMVIGCGTAITLDLVDSDGTHLGGYIVPGVEMMRQSLFSGTHAVKLAALQWPQQLAPGDSTQAAVENGVLLMAKGLIELTYSQMLQQTGDFKRIISGGDGEKLAQYLTFPCHYNAHSVFDGLAWALP